MMMRKMTIAITMRIIIHDERPSPWSLGVVIVVVVVVVVVVVTGGRDGSGAFMHFGKGADH